MVIDPARVAAALPGYDLGPELGRGAFGHVLAGTHRRLRRKVAIKVFDIASDGAQAGFASEAQVLASMDHPHIVRVYDYTEIEDPHQGLIIMELLEGGNLTRRRKGGLSPEDACAVGVAVAQALACAHARGVLHRDIKPDNILFDGAGQLKVTDFGIAKVFAGSGANASRVAGTPRYMAPEQVAAARLGPGTDLYALGVVLYELLTGTPPFFDPALPPLEQYQRQPGAAPTLPAEIPQAVGDVVLRALEKDLGARHPSAREFALDLAAAAVRGYGLGWISRLGVRPPLAEGRPDARRPAETPPPPPVPRRRPTVAVLAGLLAVALAAVAVIAWRWSEAGGELGEERRGKNELTAQELLAEADSLRETDPRLAIQLALAANRIADTDGTRAGLHETLTGTGYLGSLGHEGALRAVAFSPDGEKIAFGGERDVVLDDLTRPGRPGGNRETLPQAARVNALAFAPNGWTLAAAGDDGKVLLWNTSDPDTRPRLRQTLDGHAKPVDAIAFTPDSRTLAAAGDDGKVLLWDVSNPDRPRGPRTLGSHTRPVTAVAFRGDGGTLATGDAGGEVRVWDTAGGVQPDTPRHTLPAPDTEYTGAVTGLAYAADGRLVTAGQEQAVLVRDAADPQTVLGPPLSDHGNPVLGIAVDPDRQILALASQNGSVLLWSLAPGTQPRPLGAPVTGVPASDMIYIADGSTLYAAGGDSSLRIWDVHDPSNPKMFPFRIELSGFGAVLEITITGNTCRGPDATERRPAAGCRLAISGSTGQVKIFDVANLRRLRVPPLLADFPAHPGTPVHDMQFSEDGKRLVTGAGNGRVSVWDVDPGRPPPPLGSPPPGSVLPDRHTATVRDVQFDEAPQQPRAILATAGDDSTVRLWDLTDPRDPRLLDVLADPRGPINDVTFSRDGRTLFAAGDDGNVWGWDVGDPDHPVPLGRTLTGHRGPVYDLTNIGNRIIAAAGEDHTVRFWDVSDAHRPRRLGPLIILSDAVIDTNIARDVNRLASASADDTIRLWDIAPLLADVPDDVVEHACARADGGLSKDDWAEYIPDLPYQKTC
jgi:WD40 repeat protein